MALCRGDSTLIHVVAAVIVGDGDRVLLARRHDNAHLGGLWEFPGGKLEPGEKAEEALVRELREELGIAAHSFRPLIRLPHHYPEKSILLDVWRVEGWEGEPHGHEGQPLAWATVDELPNYPMPAADLPVINALQLPDRYLITPEPEENTAKFITRLENTLRDGIRLIQLRVNNLTPLDYRKLAESTIPLCREYGARLLLNAPPGMVHELGADGVHLNSHRLLAATKRPLPRGFLVAASCHNVEEVEHAHRIDADFSVCSPVKATHSHPDARPIGWPGLQRLTERSTFPIYALGGMTSSDLPTAWSRGAQGIAAIRGLWPEADR